MATISDVDREHEENLTTELAVALQELEKVAISRARAIVAEEMKSLTKRVNELEALIKQAASRAVTPVTATTAPSGGAAIGAVPPTPVARGAAPTFDPSSLPPLPSKRTLVTIAQYLRDLGFKLENKRAVGGGAWVFRPLAEFGPIADHLQANGIGVQRYAKGRRLYPGDHYQIDPLKVLPES